MSGKGKGKLILYDRFTDAYLKAHPDIKRQHALQYAQDLWNGLKTNKVVDQEKAENLIVQWRAKEASTSARKIGIWAAFVNKGKKPRENTEAPACEDSTPKKGARPCHLQDKLKSELCTLDTSISCLISLKNTISLSMEQERQLKNLQKQRKDTEKKLSRAKSLVKSQQKLRENKKKEFQELKDAHPEIFKQKKIERRPKAGKPPLEETMIDLHETILSIVIPQAAADEKRRSNIFNSIKTLDDLKASLDEKGYSISRTALYYRLLPKNSRHIDGKRHVNTVAVKLCRPQHDLRKKHDDAHFAMATVKHAHELAALFGRNHVFYLSQDDKARVPLGLPVSQKQTALLMHMDYKVRLPDHDFPIGERHKLIPSVYAGCVLNEDGTVGYSGPTYIAIRSGKHDCSSAESHAVDFEQLLTLNEFDDISKINREIKPLVFISVDGGPDEAPKNRQTLAAWEKHFKAMDIDAVFVFTHAPGFSAYNKVERRMAPLSKDTASIILPFDTFGSHLDKSNKTVDEDLEKKNFEAAGEILANIWSESVIDGYPVVGKFVPPPNTEEGKRKIQSEETESWKMKHVRQSQYMLQIVKCSDTTCCKPWRTNYTTFFPDRFLPPPVPIASCDAGLTICDEGKFGSMFQSLFLSKTKDIKCYDEHCPSLNKTDWKGKSLLKKRTCPKCGLYHSTIAAMKDHSRKCEKFEEETPMEESDVDEDDGPMETVAFPEDEGRNIFETLNLMYGY